MDEFPFGKIGEVTETIIKLLSLDISPGTPIYIGQSNIDHMKNNHPDDFEKYKCYLLEIINAPTYVSKNPNSGSIELIKEFISNGEHVLVAARATASGRFYVRSMYVMNAQKVERYKSNGYMFKV